MIELNPIYKQVFKRVVSVSVLCTYIAVDMVMLCYYTNRECIVDYTELYVKLSDIQQRIYLDTPARGYTRVLGQVPGHFFESYIMELIQGVYRQTKYVWGPTNAIIYEYKVAINMACDGALVIVL